MKYLYHILNYSRNLAGFFLVLLIWGSCAKPISPTGGPRDEVPPTVLKTTPENQSLRFEGNEVRITFSEAVRAPTFDKEIFISPLVKRPKILRSDNAKRIRIKFEEELRPQTTYVITLTEIKDNTEGNAMTEAYTLAFSTGDMLDSMEIKGQILSPMVGQGEKEMKVMLFDADSIINNDFLGKRPAYINKTDESGNFVFKYLRNTPYKILGIVDTDQSNTYSQLTEKVAVMEDSVLRFDPADTTQTASANLYSFLPDNTAPRLKRYVWTHPNTLAIVFTENLNLDSMLLFRTDTLGQDSLRLESYSFWRNGADPEVLLHMPVPQETYSLLHFSSVEDSLGNFLDTVLRVGPNRDRTVENPLLKKPNLNVEKQTWEILSYRLMSEADRQYVTLKDTNRVDSLQKTYPLAWQQDNFHIQLKPDTEIDPEKAYRLHIDGTFFEQKDSSLLDSTFTYIVKWFDVENYGTLSGKLIMDDSIYSGPVILQLMDKNKIIRSIRDTVFNFTHIPKGSYTFKIIADEDNNGIWTPGSLYPIKLPERIYQDANPVAIRENWDFEDHEVRMGAAPPPKTEEEEQAEQNPEGGSNRPLNRPSSGSNRRQP